MGFVLLVIVLAAVGLLLQTTLFHALPILPDIVLILCVYLGLHQQSPGGSATAFLLGYFNDSFSGNAVGLHAFTMSLVFVLVYFFSRRFWMDNVLANVGLVFVAGLLKAFTVAGLLSFYLWIDFPWAHMLTKVWFDALLAAVLAPLLFAVLDSGRRAWSVEP